MKLKPVILCGGAGTRLWPLSTRHTPKQFLSLTGNRSMIELTAERVSRGLGDSGLSFAPPLVIGSLHHAELLRNQLPHASIILEPFGRKSAPAVAAACLVSAPDDVLLILPADHHIARPERFHEAIATALPAAADGQIVTFGITPDHPSIDYGYIAFEPGAQAVKKVREFVEKPGRETAQAYLDQGTYLWNAGIFVFRADTMLAAFDAHASDIVDQVRTALPDQANKTLQLDAEAFTPTRSISIDYAILEQVKNISVVPVSMGWSDVGDYHALWALTAEDDRANTISGPATIEDSSGLFVRSDGPRIFASGLSDMVIVATPDLVMITPRGKSQAVKALGARAGAVSILPDPGRTLAANALRNAIASWADCAWDEEAGGFIEQRDMTGRPDLIAPRRMRVQARQVFTFARALHHGWLASDRAADLVDKGVAYLHTLNTGPDGGWPHVIDRNGAPVDATRDLYDHAFIMLAGAAAYEATGRADALALANGALDYIDTVLADPVGGGYFDSSSQRDHRRSNPHMHLLEAFLALHAATGDPAYLARASRIVTLFECRFFQPATDILVEHFGPDWQPLDDQAGVSFEPGHHYEWAVLLAAHDRLTGHDTLSWRRRLVKTADKLGLDAAADLCHNLVDASGAILKSTHRLWPQLERFRTRLLHPSPEPAHQPETILDTIFATYFAPMPPGLWIDEIAADGTPVSTTIPASMLYHLVTGFGELAKD